MTPFNLQVVPSALRGPVNYRDGVRRFGATATWAVIGLLLCGCGLSALGQALVIGVNAAAGAARVSRASSDAEREAKVRCALPPGDSRRLSTCPVEPAEPVPVVPGICNPEELPEWASATAAEKRALILRCHPDRRESGVR